MIDYAKQQEKMTNKELVDLAYFQIGKVEKEARISARDILRRRNIPREELRVLKEEIRRQKRIEMRQRLKDKDDNYSYFSFFSELILNVFMHW